MYLQLGKEAPEDWIGYRCQAVPNTQLLCVQAVQSGPVSGLEPHQLELTVSTVTH